MSNDGAIHRTIHRAIHRTSLRGLIIRILDDSREQKTGPHQKAEYPEVKRPPRQFIQRQTITRYQLRAIHCMVVAVVDSPYRCRAGYDQYENRRLEFPVHTPPLFPIPLFPIPLFPICLPAHGCYAKLERLYC
jgi:hypothetical protein